MKFSEEQVKKAFFKMFNESGEWYFPSEENINEFLIAPKKYCSYVTEATYLEFLDILIEIAGGYKDETIEVD